MSNLIIKRDTPKMQALEEFSFPVKADEVLPSGCYAMLNAGYAANPSASTALFGLGRVKKSVDNTGGADGAISVTVEAGAFLWDNGDSIAQADLPCPVYFGDNHTCYKAQGTKSFGGVAIKVGADGVWVVTDPAMVDAASELVTQLRLKTTTELTIDSGAITVTQSMHRVDTEADAGSDNLDTITGTVDGRVYMLRPESAARDVVIRDTAVSTTGNIRTPFGQSITLAELTDWALLVSDGTNVTVLAFRTLAANGGGAGAIAGLLASLTTTDKASLVAAINELDALLLTAPAMQTAAGTLVAGTATINTGIVITAAAEVLAFPTGVITGSTNYGSLRELKASRVNGGAGVGTIVVEALGADGAKDTDAAGAFRVVILTPIT